MAKVLIIDDSRLSVSALQNIISKLGHQVVATAFNGEDGVKKAKDTKPDVVTLDFVMPDIDGKETARRLKQVKANINIVMITQNPLPDSIKTEIFARSYIVKPITEAKVTEAFSKI
ncbi:MAG: response regulator [Candidatus Kariarchaeaceae archaeon]|jgi:two-component system chemotaxis response regulator CheY